MLLCTCKRMDREISQVPKYQWIITLLHYSLHCRLWIFESAPAVVYTFQAAVVFVCSSVSSSRSSATERPTENPHGPSCWQPVSVKAASWSPRWTRWLQSSPCETRRLSPEFTAILKNTALGILSSPGYVLSGVNGPDYVPEFLL